MLIINLLILTNYAGANKSQTSGHKMSSSKWSYLQNQKTISGNSKYLGASAPGHPLSAVSLCISRPFVVVVMKYINKRGAGSNNKSRPVSHCRVLPPGEFNDMIPQPLPVYS